MDSNGTVVVRLVGGPADGPRPARPSRASGWSSLTTPWGFPCCVRFPCVHAVATTPAQRLGLLPRSFTQPCQSSPIWLSGRPAHRPFRGLLGVHSRYGLHTRAVTVFRDTLSEGFSHFVSSIAAPVASGWSGCRVGLAPTGKAPPCHGARQEQSLAGRMKARPGGVAWLDCIR
jgi:hypothetical protein